MSTKMTTITTETKQWSEPLDFFLWKNKETQKETIKTVNKSNLNILLPSEDFVLFIIPEEKYTKRT